MAAAESALQHLIRGMHEQFEEVAPGISSGMVLPWTSKLNVGVLSIEATPRPGARNSGPILIIHTQEREERFPQPFEIITSTHITVRQPVDYWGYEGRSHSLWYCDAQEAGVFRWYETAFMFNPLLGRGRTVDPFLLNPGSEAFGALSNIMTEYQVAWPFTPIDQGEEVAFIERWIKWFISASEGRLRHPSSMPEKEPRGSWRR